MRGHDGGIDVELRTDDLDVVGVQSRLGQVDRCGRRLADDHRAGLLILGALRDLANCMDRCVKGVVCERPADVDHAAGDDGRVVDAHDIKGDLQFGARFVRPAAGGCAA